MVKKAESFKDCADALVLSDFDIKKSEARKICIVQDAKLKI
jgi:hypothetical protein